MLGLAHTFPRPGWVVLDAIRERSLTGEVVCRTTPKMTVWADRGHVYHAEREDDPALGDRLLMLNAPMLRGDDVADLQRSLNHLGFDCGRPDGIFGPATANALKDSQTSQGIAATGTVDAVLDGETGVLVPVGDVAALAAALAEVADDPEIAGKLGDAAARWVREEFEPQRVWARLEEGLEQWLAA